MMSYKFTINVNQKQQKRTITTITRSFATRNMKTKIYKFNSVFKLLNLGQIFWSNFRVFLKENSAGNLPNNTQPGPGF